MSDLVQVAVIAAHDLMRSGLVSLLDQPLADMQVVGAARTVEQLDFAALEPDILLLDDLLAGNASILPVLEQLRADYPLVPVVVLSGRLRTRYLHALFAVGAAGFIDRDERLDEVLMLGLRVVYEGHAYTSPRAANLLINPPPEDRISLNTTDLAVLRALDAGQSAKEISRSLHLTVRSVYRIRGKLIEALGARTHEHLIAEARAQGLVGG